YGGILPVPVLILSLFAPSFFFALAVLAGRFVRRRVAPLAGVLTFAALWAGFDFLESFNSGGGAVGTPAPAEAGMPMMMQTASLVGPWGITFLLGFVSAGLALALRTRSWVPAAVAIAVFAGNAAFGIAHMAPAPDGTVRVALINSDA